MQALSYKVVLESICASFVIQSSTGKYVVQALSYVPLEPGQKEPGQISRILRIVSNMICYYFSLNVPYCSLDVPYLLLFFLICCFFPRREK